jgi:very-short-patch-repair endonuclease
LLLPGDAALLDALDRHARRRLEGIATLSVLVGPPERALELWNGWVQRHGLRVLLTEQADERAMVLVLAEELSRQRSLMADAEVLVSLAQPPGARRALFLPDKTAYERRVLLENLAPPISTPGAWELCRHLLEAAPPPAPGDLPDGIREAIARDPAQALQSLLAIAPAGSQLTLRIRTGPAVFQRLRTAAALCAAAPALTVACALSVETFEDCMRQSGSRVHAMMQEGRLDLDRQPTRPEGSGPDAQELERARSKPERFLYEQLCYRPSTAGLFALNATVDLEDGNGLREVDLLCRELRLAVEIDGFFHFRAPDGFRRDQRKNVALQRAGYLVVRYLADDVVSRLEEILDELDTLIAARRREAARQEYPNGHR